ncbi:hypothetical protein FB451DRAFT_1191569 [Mycena latifolia]|nr:hypothetical protein FB451DRAFT_1191569 [Mycena latifolia]
MSSCHPASRQVQDVGFAPPPAGGAEVNTVFHAHIESWAAAMLNPQKLAAQSPLLQRRLELKEKSTANNAPQVHLNFLSEFLGLLRPQAAGPALPAHAAPIIASTMLIPPPLLPGPNLTIDQFCADYNLDDDIRTRFKDQKFKHTDAFKYVELAELKAMEFKVGEIAELKVAIAAWAQRPVE